MDTEILKGQAALDATKKIFSLCQVPAVIASPRIKPSGPCTLAIATPAKSILVDPGQSKALADWMCSAQKPIAAHDAKAVHKILFDAWDKGPSRWACLEQIAKLLSEGEIPNHPLETLAQICGFESPPSPKQGLDAFFAYATWIASVAQQSIPILQEKNMTWVSRIEASAVAPIAEMEVHGMPFDSDKWQALHHQAVEEKGSLETRIAKYFSDVLGTDLFGTTCLDLHNDRELKRVLHGAGHLVPNVRRQTLAELPKPLGPWLSQYRTLLKLTSTYGDSFLQSVQKDGRIHPTFEQIGTSTGRMACHSPNLQAVVKGDAHRACFAAPQGRHLVIADYAACELRILAEMSHDPVFREAFSQDQDVHARVASEIFGKTVSKTENADLRQRAKAINFGLVYGMGANGLARTIGSDLHTAKQLFAQYFKTFPNIGRFLEQSAKGALQKGYACTPTGRRLRIQARTDANTRAQAMRIAKNMPIQGTSADITKIALARLHKQLLAFKQAWIVNAIHDEIVVECDKADTENVKVCVQHEMQAAGQEILKNIPVKVDVLDSAVWDK